MKLMTQSQGGILIIRPVEARIDAASALQFKECVRRAADGTKGPVVLDLSCVEFLDSSGLGAIVSVRKGLGADRPLELAGLAHAVEKVFRLTRMDTIFIIHAAVPDAAGLRDAG